MTHDPKDMTLSIALAFRAAAAGLSSAASVIENAALATSGAEVTSSAVTTLAGSETPPDTILEQLRGVTSTAPTPAPAPAPIFDDTGQLISSWSDFTGVACISATLTARALQLSPYFLRKLEIDGHLTRRLRADKQGAGYQVTQVQHLMNALARQKAADATGEAR